MNPSGDDVIRVEARVAFPDDSQMPHHYANVVRALVGADEVTFIFYDVTPPAPERIVKAKKGEVEVNALPIAKFAVPKSLALKLIDVLEAQRWQLEGKPAPKKKARKRAKK